MEFILFCCYLLFPVFQDDLTRSLSNAYLFVTITTSCHCYLGTSMLILCVSLNFNTPLVVFLLVCEVTLKHNLVAVMDKRTINNFYEPANLIFSLKWSRDLTICVVIHCSHKWTTRIGANWKKDSEEKSQEAVSDLLSTMPSTTDKTWSYPSKKNIIPKVILLFCW